MQHYRQKYKAYRSKIEPITACPFCDHDNETKHRIIKQNKHSYIIQNRTKYDIWEGHDVSEHYMVIPKRHVAHLKELTSEERLDIMSLGDDHVVL